MPSPIFAVALNADGSRLALGCKNGQLQIYEVATAKLLESLLPLPVETADK